MRQPLSQGMSSNVATFWRSYVYVGVLTYSLGAVAVVSYALTTSGPHRRAIVILGGLSLIASVGPFRLLGLRLVSTTWSKTFFGSWAASTFVLIAVGAVLDGGVRSPIAYFLVLPMLFVGLAYSAGTVTLLAGVRGPHDLAVGVLTPDRSWPTTAFLAVGMVIAGVITAAAAANRDRLMRQLMEAASLDALTGCLSRGAFEERLEHESTLARRHGTVFSVIVADVDNLKTLNDASGHHCGDRALRLLATVLRQGARETDVVGRLGGDEFAMLLHETGQEAAMTGRLAPERGAARRGRVGHGHGQSRGEHVAGAQRRTGGAPAPCRRSPVRGQAVRTRPRPDVGSAGRRGAGGAAVAEPAPVPGGQGLAAHRDQRRQLSARARHGGWPGAPRRRPAAPPSEAESNRWDSSGSPATLELENRRSVPRSRAGATERSTRTSAWPVG